MSREGIMRSARRRFLALILALFVPAVFAQTPPANGDDLDVTMRVIVDPNAKVPDEIVRRIQLPKPAQPATPSEKPNDKGKPADSGKPADKGKPPEPGAQGQQRASEARQQGREFGEQVAEEAKQRSEEARRNKPPKPPGPPRGPPNRPNPPSAPLEAVLQPPGGAE